MRAATWATNRDISAARLSWERARTIADALPADDPDRAAMRIAPRTMLCGSPRVMNMRLATASTNCVTFAPPPGTRRHWPSGWRGSWSISPARPDARGVAAGVRSNGPYRVARRSDLDGGAVFPLVYAKGESGEWSEVLRWSQQVIDLADGDPSKGIHCRISLSARIHDAGYGRGSLGRPGWRDDRGHGWPWPARRPASYSAVITTSISLPYRYGALRLDDPRWTRPGCPAACRATGDDLALSLARMTRGGALVHCSTWWEHDRGHGGLTERQRPVRCLGHNAGGFTDRRGVLGTGEGSAGRRAMMRYHSRASSTTISAMDNCRGWHPRTVLVETLLASGSRVTLEKPRPPLTG